MVKLEELRKKIPTQITVLGGGSWATALVKILCENNVKIKWWIRRKSDVDFIRKYNHNPSYLTDVVINPRKVKTYHKMTDALQGTDFIILAIPAAFIPSTLKDLHKKHFEGKKVVSAIKGMIPEENLLVTDWIEKNFELPIGNSCVIAGPCHAEEIALERLSYLTVGSENAALSNPVAIALRCRYVEVSENDDLFGAELSAILKNIYAIASGMFAGLGYGDNFQAVLVSNALQEMKRFIDVVHPIHRDVNSSAYLGDLLVTAYSKFSRNRTFGFMLGQGYTLQSAKLELTMVAEGYYAARSLMEINQKFQVEMPILSAVYSVLYEGANCQRKMKELTSKLS